MNGLGSALPPPWQRVLPLFMALVVLLLVVYWSAWQGMVAIWLRSETYAHALVVPPISLWLVWRKRAALRECTPQPDPWMLLPLALLASLWMLGDLVSANAATQLAITAMLVVTVPALLGWRVTQVILFPLLFLFFAVPIGESLTPMLMQWTADFTVVALRASGIPVYREGLQFVIPSGHWSVVEACSGIRYLMASFMVGCLFAYLNYRSTWRRLVFALVAISLPVLANWLRAYMIVMLGHLSNNQIATGADHLLYGWVFFGIVIMGMFLIGSRWAEPDDPVPGAGVGAAATVAADVRSPWPVALAFAVLLLAPPLAMTRWVVTADDAAPQLLLPSVLAAGWTAGSSPVLDAWRPAYVEMTTDRQQTYLGRDAAVGLYLAYYRAQNGSRKLISSRNQFVDSADHRWNQITTQPDSAVLVDRVLQVQAAELLAAVPPGQSERSRLLVWRYYWVGGHLTSSDVVAKLYSAWQRVSSQVDESAAVFVYATEGRPGEARARLQNFMRENFDQIDGLLLQAAASAP